MRITLIIAAVIAGLSRTCLCDEVTGYSELANDLIAPLSTTSDASPNPIRNIFSRQREWCTAGSPYVLCPTPRTCCSAKDNWWVVSLKYNPGYQLIICYMLPPRPVHRLGAAPRLPRRAVGDSVPNPVLSAVGIMSANQVEFATFLLEGNLPAAGVPVMFHVVVAIVRALRLLTRHCSKLLTFLNP